MAGSRQDESTQAAGGWGPVATGCVALAVAAGGWVATGATSGVLRIVCGLLTLVAGGYGVYLFGLLLMFVVVRRFFEHGGPGGVGDRIPWSVWVLIPALVVSWALWAWLAGYDAEQWWWTGISVTVASVVIVLAFVRRRRDPLPDGPKGPHDRRRPDD